MSAMSGPITDKTVVEHAARADLVAELHALAVADAQAGVGLSLEEWRIVLHAHPGSYSVRRAWLGEAAEDQLDRLASGVVAEDPVGNRAVAERIAALPLPQRIAVFDTIDRFWSRGGWIASSPDVLVELGVVFADSAHERARAARARGNPMR